MYLLLSARWRALFIRESYLSALFTVFEGIIRALLVHFSLFLCLLAAQSPFSPIENLMADVFREMSLFMPPSLDQKLTLATMQHDAERAH